ncbi:MAG: hypothetical protein H6751_04635 [Candidatus Omnitrophica bacterium]|nr:hypothetical protein [Candidatus Omnitrophota bacterium]MCA9435724.1 hypothetical protein [Candidatus Omnitrophota bacterium]MCA9440247.1 hypothetical protein [Candidatus Omnitrophota bacterium]MCB9782231.1 hypothetical protein [Candidatus Omnitrophota bacterium]
MWSRNFLISTCISLTLLACLASHTDAADIRYMSNGDWNTASGWVGGAIPGDMDRAILNWGGNTVTLAAQAPDVLDVRIGQDENSNLQVNAGGTLNVLNRLYVGHNNSTGTMTVASGAVVNVTDILWVGGNGSPQAVTGTLTIEAGGTVNVGNHLWWSAGAAGVATVNISGNLNQTGGILGLGTIDASNPSGGVATVNVNDGGVLALNNISGSGGSIQPGSIINIFGSGQVTIPGDFVSVIGTYAGNGYFAGDGVVGNVQADLTTNPGFTTVTVVQAAPVCMAGNVRYMNSGDWLTASNWQTGNVPCELETAILNWGNNTVTLNGAAPDVYQVRIGQDEDSTLEVNAGGSLTVVQRLYVGHNNSTGTMLVANGAVVNVTDILWVGGNGSPAAVTGTLTIEAGGEVNFSNHLWAAAGAAGLATINVSGVLNQTGGILGLGTIDAVNPSGGVATLNVEDGGVLNLFNIHAAGTSIQPGSILNINGSGQVTLPGDFEAVIADYASNGYIAGDGVPGNIQTNLTSNPGFTTVIVAPLAVNDWGLY